MKAVIALCLLLAITSAYRHLSGTFLESVYNELTMKGAWGLMDSPMLDGMWWLMLQPSTFWMCWWDGAFADNWDDYKACQLTWLKFNFHPW